MSKLLINEQPLQVLPSLAKKIGLNEAIVLQQIHWLLQFSKHQFGGRAWLYNTYEQWQENHFPFWSVDTVKRTILSLEKQGLLLSTTSFNRMKVDKTKWYSIDYVVLEGLDYPTTDFARPSGQIAPSKSANCPDVTGQIAPTNNQEIIQENTTRDLLTPLPPTGKSAVADEDAVAGLAENSETTTACKKSKLPLVDYAGIAQAYNDAVIESGKPLPKVADPENLSDKRKRAVHKLAKQFQKRFGQYTPSAFRDYFDDFMRSASSWYFGENNRGWKADFEYLLRETTLDKTIEGGL